MRPQIWAGLIALLFAKEAYVGQAHYRTKSIDQLVDGASVIFKVEPISGVLEEVTVKESKTGKEFILQYLGAKVVEVLKLSGAQFSTSPFEVKIPPASGLHSFVPPGNAPMELPKVGSILSITSLSPLHEPPSPEKHYIVHQIESPARPTDKSMYFFSTGYDSALKAWPGENEFGLVALSVEPALKKAIALRSYFDAVRANSLALLGEAAGKHAGLINAVDPTWGTPLQFAARYGKKEHIDFLISKGASLATPNANGESVLFDLLTSGFLENLKALLQSGAPVNSRDSHAHTPLHVAVQLQRKDAVSLLIGSGADLGLKNSAGETPLALARRLGHAEILKLLEAAGQGSAP